MSAAAPFDLVFLDAWKPDYKRFFDMVYPRLEPGGAPLLVHYWAPWERHSRAQILGLDSLMAGLPEGHVRVAVVCFDPFPSVARFVARARVSSPVMLDLRRELQAQLPCPSIPYTWLVTSDGRVLVAQPGEVDWSAPATRTLLLEAARDTVRTDPRLKV